MKNAFDCVAMKDAIQKQMIKQIEGLSDEQRRAAVRDVLEKSRSPIGDLWRTLKRRATADGTCVAETGGMFGGGCTGYPDCKGVREMNGSEFSAAPRLRVNQNHEGENSRGDAETRREDDGNG